jgi:tRNA modification GTPase
MSDTIVAISSGLTTCGIVILRMSGSDVKTIAQKMLPNLDLEKVETRRLNLTTIKGDDFTDKGMVVYFKAPYSFTGEDVVEFQIHGGVALAKLVLNGCLKSGARMAEPGEFSKRAFINGKMSLEEAEGTIDIINAESEAEIKCGYNLLNGKLRDKTDSLQKTLTDIIAENDVALDYPEEDIDYTTKKEMKNKMINLRDEIQNLISTFKTGKIVKNGIEVSIIGRPNVGKSSLLNSLLNYERAIVTDEAGTTRDIIEESYIYNGVRVNLLDTAGIRDSDNKIEKIGIERAKETLNSCNVALLVLDSTMSLNEEDSNIISLLKMHNDLPIIVAVNKVDIGQDAGGIESSIKRELPTARVIEISAKNNVNVDKLKQLIYDDCIDNQIDSDKILITNERHLDALSKALESLNEGINNIDNYSLDCISLDLKNAWNFLGEITGKNLNDEVIDAIFSKFCLGK